MEQQVLKIALLEFIQVLYGLGKRGKASFGSTNGVLLFTLTVPFTDVSTAQCAPAPCLLSSLPLHCDHQNGQDVHMHCLSVLVGPRL